MIDNDTIFYHNDHKYIRKARYNLTDNYNLIGTIHSFRCTKCGAAADIYEVNNRFEKLVISSLSCTEQQMKCLLK